MRLIEIDHLRLSIGEVPVLHDVCLEVAPGEVVGLLGPNGAGRPPRSPPPSACCGRRAARCG